MAVDQCITGGLGPAGHDRDRAQPDGRRGPSTCISVSGGTGADATRRRRTSCRRTSFPRASTTSGRRRFRHAVGVPVLVAGRNVEPEVAEAGLAVGRGPDRHDPGHHRGSGPAAEGRQRGAEATRASASTRAASDGSTRGCPMWCSVNPAIREPGARSARSLRRSRADRRGGRRCRGPGGRPGCGAAWVTNVVVFERRPDLRRPGPASPLSVAGASAGGCTSTGSVTRRSPRASEIRLGTSADVATVLAEQPDAVILATGSRLRDEAQPSGARCCSTSTPCWSTVCRTAPISRALVLDDEGGFLAPTAAEALVAAGCTVEIATTHTQRGEC